MTGGTHPAERLQAADRISAAYTTITRWAARDFKRTKAPSGLTSTQFAILVLVHRFDGLSISQLADRLDLTVPTVVRAVDALERKRLVVRQRSMEDQREVKIAATSEGKRARADLEQARRERLMRLLSAMSEAEIQSLLVGYEALARAALVQEEEERRAV